jgi:rRNA-processing protein FCF1
VRTVVYDSGALLAAERGNARFVALHRRWLQAGITPVVPTVVLAQVWRTGPRQAMLARLLAGCRPHPLTVAAARSIGEFLSTSDTRDIVDASVIVTAQEMRPVAVVTSDREDLEHLAQAIGIGLTIVDV